MTKKAVVALALAAAPAGAVDVGAVRAQLAAMKAAHARELEQAPEGPTRYALRLRQMSDEDQLVRLALMKLPAAEWQGRDGKRLGALMSEQDRANTAELRRLIAERGWPRRDALGERADDAAWLIVQHADLDLPFQKEVLVLLDGLRRDGGTAPRHYAYLYDRVAVNEGRPQLYGTQGRCEGGAWVAEPVDRPEELDARREEMGLMPQAEYVALNKKGCA